MLKLDKNQWITLIVVWVLTLAIFAPTVGYDFVNWDDQNVVVQNLMIQDGLSAKMIKEAFSTSQVRGQYYPVTLMTFALNFSIGKLNPGGYHFLNVLFHLLNIFLLYVILTRLFKKRWMAAFVILLFAIHPMHVEPVAWIASRKDVLYLFFMLLAWWTYLEYREGGSRKKLFFAFSIGLMLLSVFSKAAGIVFPAVLLLTDFLQKRKDLKPLLLEKIPFAVITVIFVGIGYLAQKEGNAVMGIEKIQLHESLAYGGLAFMTYVFKALVPIQLAAYHPYPAGPGQPVPWYAYASIAGALGLVALAVWKGRKNRKIGFAAGLFILSIFPFLQFLPVGPSIIAERFTYFPYVGLFILMALGLEWVGKKVPKLYKKKLNWQLALLGLSVPFLVMSFLQVPSWNNGETMWSQVIKVYPSSGVSYVNRADFYLNNGEDQKALEDYNRSIEVEPNFEGAWNNRGLMYFSQNNYPKALTDFNEALKLNPNNPRALMNCGLIYMNTGELASAMQNFNQSLALDSTVYEAYYNRGFLYGMQGNYQAAIVDLNKSIALNQFNPLAFKDRAMAHFLLQKYDQARQDYTQAIELEPSFGEAYLGRSHCWNQMGNLENARSDARKAIELGVQPNPQYREALGI